MSIDAMKQALWALEHDDEQERKNAVHSLRLAIEQAERQEPVCEYCGGDRFTTQPQRQPLTVEEIEQATGCDRNKPLWIAIENAARAVERAHAIGGKQ